MPRDKPYICIVCNQRFVNSQVLANHFKEHDHKSVREPLRDSEREPLRDSEQENINILYKDELQTPQNKNTTQTIIFDSSYCS